MAETVSHLTHQLEIYLRGRTLQACSLLEMLLAQLMVVCRADELNSEPYKFRQLNYSGKVREATKAINEKHPEIYSKNIPLFEELKDLSKLRNKIAHCNFQWLDGRPDIITIWDIAEDAGGQYFEMEKHNFEDLVQVIERFKKCVVDLNPIVENLKIEFDERYPGLLNLSAPLER